jgi:pimeloyl-ACP methyl ester carboxylesterase
MIEMKVNTLQVDGASIYYEIRGSGPILLLISGGFGDASVLNILYEYLIDKFTVITYDRRGYTRSKIDEPTQELRLETESDDVHRLLTTISNEPAYVFGSSYGAVIALDYAARHPKQLHPLVAHEPSALYLTSIRTEAEQALNESIEKSSKHNNPTIAYKTISKMVGLNPEKIKAQKTDNNLNFFIQNEVPMLDTYRYDFKALKKAMKQTQIIIAAGSTSPHNSIGYLGAVAISEHLGVDIVEFPGDHIGYGRNPEKFVEKLLEVFND